jgi:hypothetical protein
MNKVLYAREGAKNIMDNTFDCFPWDVKLEIDGSKIDIPQASASHFDYSSMLFFMFWHKHIILTGISARKNL